MNNTALQIQWETMVQYFSKNLQEPISMEGILLFIGIQESNIFKDTYSKEEKIDLIHIGMCSILASEGYYAFSHYDEEKWPHYNHLKPLPAMNIDEEKWWIKKNILLYCQANELI